MHYAIRCVKLVESREQLTPYVSMNESSEKEVIWTAGQAVPSPVNFLKFGNARANMIFANLMPSEFTIHYNIKTTRIQDFANNA